MTRGTAIINAGLARILEDSGAYGPFAPNRSGPSRVVEVSRRGVMNEKRTVGKNHNRSHRPSQGCLTISRLLWSELTPKQQDARSMPWPWDDPDFWSTVPAGLYLNRRVAGSEDKRANRQRIVSHRENARATVRRIEAELQRDLGLIDQLLDGLHRDDLIDEISRAMANYQELRRSLVDPTIRHLQVLRGQTKNVIGSIRGTVADPSVPGQTF